MKTTNVPSEAEVLIQKLPCDMGIHRTGRKGTLNAPSALLEDTKVEDRAHISEVFPDEFDLEETHRRIQHHTEEMLQYNAPLLSIGGDHSISYPVLKAVKQHQPDLSLVWMDAHLDAKDPVGGHTSHDVVMRELVEDQIFGVDEILCIGTTQIDDDERDLEEDLSILDYSAIEQRSVAVDSPVYLSFDIDVLAIRGTGYPDGRMSLSRCQEVINSFDVRHSDLVEVAPPLCGDAVSTGRNVLSMLLEALGESY